MKLNRFGERAEYSREALREWCSNRDPSWKFEPGESPIAVFMQFRFLRRLRAWLLDRPLTHRLKLRRAREWRLKAQHVIECIDSITDL